MELNFVNYFLMHKNIKTAILTINDDTGTLVSLQVIDKNHMPIGTDNMKAFSNWWERRAVPKHQKGTAIFLKNDTPLSYMVKNLGLSLIDCYWIAPFYTNDLTWEKVNLYENSLSIDGFIYSDKENQSPFKPSATAQGELKKRWIRKKDGTYLIKGNSGASYQQSINEVVAALIHSKQNQRHTNYDLINLDIMDNDKGLGCISKNFTNQNLEFIPAYDVSFMSKKPGDISDYAHFLNLCIENGCPKQETLDYADYIILSDFLITNTDRHLLNIGILRNPNTLEFVSLAPIFDCGNSMFYKQKFILNSVLDITTTSWGGNLKETKLLNYVHNFDNIDLNKIPSWDEIKSLYSIDEYSSVYLSNIEEGFSKKIELLWALQNGYSLNQYKKNFYINTFVQL